MNLRRLKSSELLYILFVIILVIISKDISVESKIAEKTNTQIQQHWNSYFRNQINESISHGIKSNKSLNDEPGYDITIDTNYIVNTGSTNKTLRYNTKRDSNDNMCNTENKCRTIQCKTEASRFLYYIDHSATNKSFYDYACGGFNQNELNIEPDGREETFKIIKDELDKIRTDGKNPSSEGKLKSFYNSCLKYEEVSSKEREEQAKKVFNSVDLKYVNENEPFNLTKTILTLIKLDSFPVFDVRLEIDHNNASRLAIRLTPPSNYLFNIQNIQKLKCKKIVMRDLRTTNLLVLYENYRKCLREHSEYLNDMNEATSKFKEFGNSQGSEALNTTLVETATRETLIKIFNMKLESLNNVTYFSIEQLQRRFKQVEWNVLLSTLLKNPITDKAVQVYHLNDLSYIFRLFNNAQKARKMNNALVAHFAQNIYKYFVKPKEAYHSEKFCLEILTRLVPDVTANLLTGQIGAKKLNDQLNKVSEVFTSLNDTFFQQLQVVRGYSKSWIDNQTYEGITRKLGTFKYLTPVAQLSPPSVEVDFEKVLLENNYLADSITLIKRKQELMFSLDNMKSNSPEVIWLLYSRPFSGNSIYIYEINTLVIPQGVLLKHHESLPEATTMARLGYDIASGIVRAFDKYGIKFDYKNTLSWTGLISNPSYISFSLIFSSVKGSYERIELLEAGKSYIVQNENIFQTPNSELLLNEKVTDVSATKLAFQTMKSRLSENDKTLEWGDFCHDQLYFLTLAQRFCTRRKIPDWFTDIFEKPSLPPFMRMKSIFSNSDDFMKTKITFPHANFQEFVSNKPDSTIQAFPHYEKFSDRSEV